MATGSSDIKRQLASLSRNSRMSIFRVSILRSKKVPRCVRKSFTSGVPPASTESRRAPGLFAVNLLLGLLQLNDLATLVGQRQFVAEPFALANDGLALDFTLLVELIHVPDRPPVGDVPHFTVPEKAV